MSVRTQLYLFRYTHFLLKGQFCGCSGSSFPSNSTTYSSCAGRSLGYGLPPPIGGSGSSVALLLRLAPTVWTCCSLCVAVRCCSIGCVRVLVPPTPMVALDAVAILPISCPSLEDEETLEEELDRAVPRRSSDSRSRRSLLVCDQVRVASCSARSMSLSTISIFAIAGVHFWIGRSAHEGEGDVGVCEILF